MKNKNDDFSDYEFETNFIHNRNKCLEGLIKIIHRFQFLTDMYCKRTNEN